MEARSRHDHNGRLVFKATNQTNKNYFHFDVDLFPALLFRPACFRCSDDFEEKELYRWPGLVQAEQESHPKPQADISLKVAMQLSELSLIYKYAHTAQKPTPK